MAVDINEAGDIADTICRALIEPASDAPAEDKARFASRMSGLSAEERNAVRQALEFLAHEYDRAGYPDNPAQTALG
jgi:hypothetical protein